MDIDKSLTAGNARKGIELMDLGNAADIGCRPEVDFAGKSNIDDLTSSLGHDFFNTCMNDIFLSGSLQKLVLVN